MPKFEKIEYKPIPVSELLLEMKNLSELMIDLAYSAALFNDKELAEDIIELEARVDTLAYLLDMEIMIAARDYRDAESLIGVSTVAAATDKISDAAADIAGILTHNIGIHPLVTRIFEKAEKVITKATVKDGSTIIGKPIGKLAFAPRLGVDIIAIRRNKDWIIKPKNSERAFRGDVLIVRGAPQGVKDFKELAEGTSTRLEEKQ
jgi:uncharacterized protein with PhoU and TrkA domain